MCLFDFSVFLLFSIFCVLFHFFYRPVAFFNFSDVYVRMHFCVFAILFSRLYWVLLLLLLFLLLLSICIIYFFIFVFDMDYWSDTDKWLIDCLTVFSELWRRAAHTWSWWRPDITVTWTGTPGTAAGPVSTAAAFSRTDCTVSTSWHRWLQTAVLWYTRSAHAIYPSLRAGCTNAQLTVWLANRGLTLTAQLTRCRVARSTVN